MKSKKGKLISQDWKKIGKGFLIATGGSALAYILQEIIPMLKTLDLNEWELMLVVIASVVINTLYKVIKGTDYSN